MDCRTGEQLMVWERCSQRQWQKQKQIKTQTKTKLWVWWLTPIIIAPQSLRQELMKVQEQSEWIQDQLGLHTVILSQKPNKDVARNLVLGLQAWDWSAGPMVRRSQLSWVNLWFLHTRDQAPTSCPLDTHMLTHIHKKCKYIKNNNNKTQRNKSTKAQVVEFEVFRCPATTFALLIEITSSSWSRKSCQGSSIYKRFIAELTFLGMSFFLPLLQNTHKKTTFDLC